MSNLDPFSFLEEMLHSDYYEDFEQERICPICNYGYPTHDDLVHHIFRRHPEHFKTYVTDIDELLSDPFRYLSVEWDNLSCRFCGEVFPSKGEFNRHMKFHTHEIERFKKEFGEKR